mmetsp:Transcript_36781/g.87383  ORF Transcript_36781/g.87383 Transcript_36781/m.87383 type:complete len:416 (+) Transcript_36781:511-1758(+)
MTGVAPWDTQVLGTQHEQQRCSHRVHVADWRNLREPPQILLIRARLEPPHPLGGAPRLDKSPVWDVGAENHEAQVDHGVPQYACPEGLRVLPDEVPCEEAPMGSPADRHPVGVGEARGDGRGERVHAVRHVEGADLTREALHAVLAIACGPSEVDEQHRVAAAREEGDGHHVGRWERVVGAAVRHEDRRRRPLDPWPDNERLEGKVGEARDRRSDLESVVLETAKDLSVPRRLRLQREHRPLSLPSRADGRRGNHRGGRQAGGRGHEDALALREEREARPVAVGRRESPDAARGQGHGDHGEGAPPLRADGHCVLVEERVLDQGAPEARIDAREAVWPSIRAGNHGDDLARRSVRPLEAEKGRGGVVDACADSGVPGEEHEPLPAGREPGGLRAAEVTREAPRGAAAFTDGGDVP